MKKWIKWIVLMMALLCVAATVRIDWDASRFPTNNVGVEYTEGTNFLGNTNVATFNLLVGKQYDFILKSGETPFLNLTIKPIYTPPPLIYTVIEGENNTGGTNVNYFTTNGVTYMYFNSSGVGHAEYSFNIPQTADVMVWARVKADSGAQDSFYVEADVPDTLGVTNTVFDTAFPEEGYPKDWEWRKLIGRGTEGETTPYDTNLVFNPRIWHFPAGSHTLTFRSRERSTELDKFVITSDLANTNPPSD